MTDKKKYVVLEKRNDNMEWLIYGNHTGEYYLPRNYVDFHFHCDMYQGTKELKRLGLLCGSKNNIILQVDNLENKLWCREKHKLDLERQVCCQDSLEVHIQSKLNQFRQAITLLILITKYVKCIIPKRLFLYLLSFLEPLEFKTFNLKSVFNQLLKIN